MAQDFMLVARQGESESESGTTSDGDWTPQVVMLRRDDKSKEGDWTPRVVAKSSQVSSVSSSTFASLVPQSFF